MTGAATKLTSTPISQHIPSSPDLLKRIRCGALTFEKVIQSMMYVFCAPIFPLLALILVIESVMYVFFASIFPLLALILSLERSPGSFYPFDLFQGSI